MTKRHWSLVALGGGVLAAAAVAWTFLGGQPASTGAPRGSTLNQPVSLDPRTLNNLLRDDARARAICEQYLTPPLVDLHPDSLEPVPVLAAALPEVSEDRLVYTWRLRAGARWEDGTPVTTRDVEVSYRLASHPESGARRLRALLDTVSLLEVVDPHVFRVHTKEPYFRAMLEWGTNFALVPAHKLEGVSPSALATHPIGRQPLAYGPYRLESWETDKEIVLVRNDTYFGPPPSIERVRYRVLKDDRAYPRLLDQGVIDWAVFSQDDWTRSHEDAGFDGRFQRLEYYFPSVSCIGWNCRRPPFSDSRVRRAVSHAIRRQEILDRLFAGQAKFAVGPFASTDPACAADLAPPAFDLETSRRLLAEAGWKDSDGDGVLDREGRRFEFELQHPTTPTPAMTALLTSLKGDLEKIGVVCRLRTVEFGTLNTNLNSRQFDAFLVNWTMQPIDDDPFRLLHSSLAESGMNYSGVADPEMDRLLETARREFDRAARNRLYRRVQEIVNDEQPMSFLYQAKVLLAVSRRFAGVKAHPRGIRTLEWSIASD